MRCFRCGGDQAVKNGIVHGRQRYRCRGCGCNYTRPKAHGYHMADKCLAVILHLSGMSMNSIAPIIGVSTQSVMRWIKSFGDQTPAPWEMAASGRVREVEIDEMHHFLQKKAVSSGSGKCWIITPANSWGGFVGIAALPPARK